MIILDEADIRSEFATNALGGRKTALTIGNFDGVHLGHQQIISRIKEHAGKLDALATVLTFNPHPRKVISSPSGLKLITPDEGSKSALLEKLGIEAMVVIEFTSEFAAISPREFFEQGLLRLNPAIVVVGHDFAFGRGGAGNVEMLESFAREKGFELEVVEPIMVHGSVVSSSRVRNLVAAGEVEAAQELLGRPYSMSGTVIKGHERGKSIGFPTINLDYTSELLPRDGVYITLAVVEGSEHPAMTNIGDNPTFGDGEISLEAHLIGFEGDLYGKVVELEFLTRLRDEIKFDSVDDLKRRLLQDKMEAEKYFKN